MRSTVATEQLRACVVRLAAPGGGRILGTGILAGRGWVLTCAHVVAEFERVELADYRGHPFAEQATVVARSSPREATSPSKLWPFPDLALLRFDAPGQHPVALLDASNPPRPGEEQPCVAWGFARREVGVDPTGSPTSFQFQGIEGDDFLSLRSGMVAPGLSGAPLVSPQQRAVVGVITATRHPDDELGGWAAPIWPLTAQVDGVPEEIVKFGRQMLEANHAAVLRDRSAWHAVLPVKGHEALIAELVSWGEYRRGERSDPADLLLPEYRVVRYLFREAELDDLQQWCLGPEAASVAVVAGAGGSGKTRGAIELCALMSTKGWVAGELSDMDERLLDRLVETPLPRLIIVDYAEGQPPKELGAWIGRLAAKASDIHPVRVVLLNRERTASQASNEGMLDGLRSDASVTVKRLLDDHRAAPGVTSDLSHDQRLTLFHEARRCFAEAWGTAEPNIEPSLLGDSYSEPLGVLYEALLCVLEAEEPREPRGAPGEAWPTTPAGRLLAHEEKYWLQTSPQDEHPHILRQCVALATLAGASCAADAEAALAALPPLEADDASERRRRIGQWLSRLFRGARFWNPLRPDRLGESLVAHVLLRDETLPTLRRLLATGAPDQLQRALEVLGRCVGSGRPTSRDAIRRVIADTLPALVRGAERAATGDGRASIGRSATSHALVDLLFALGLEGLASREPDNTGYQRDVSVSLERLGHLATQGGDVNVGHDLLSRASTTRLTLVRREPGRVDLAEEAAVALLLLLSTVSDSTESREIRERVRDLLEPFADEARLTSKGKRLLRWVTDR